MKHEHLSHHLTLTFETRSSAPSIPWVAIKNAILGKTYELSLVFPSPKTATQLHRDWKEKDGPANILSFPLDDQTGEIFISLNQAKKECKKFDRTYDNYLAFLFIHGCAHLKGYTHGSAMESYEKTIRKKFNI
jgi:rRNA maturation RNase YbeY